MEEFFVGIDISKRKFDVALLIGTKVKQKVCTNDQIGFAELQNWLQRNCAEWVHVCMEATGTYYEALALALIEAGHLVSVVNPARIKGFSMGTLQRTKTDKSDAALIARFCQAMKPATWSPPAIEVRELRALVRRLDELQEILQMERNRLSAGGSSEAVDQSRQALAAKIEEEIARTVALVREHFNSHPGLKADRDLLTSIPGVGATTAAVLLAEIGNVANFSTARELAAFCGLTPRDRTSGSSVRGRPRMCKTGNARLRKALYMPAVVAKNHNPIIKAFCKRLLTKGKPKMAVVGAAMRKLLHIAFGVLKHQQPFSTELAMA